MADALYSELNTPRYAIIPEEIMISPNKHFLNSLLKVRDLSQFFSSSLSLEIKALALSSCFSASSNLSYKYFFLASAASSSSTRAFISASTALSFSIAASQRA
jgi:hypothetical protein